MCFKNITIKQKTIEEIIAENSAGMSDSQKGQYAYELNLRIHELLTKVDGFPAFKINPEDFRMIAVAQYPTLTDFQIPDSYFMITDQASMQEILTKDWSNLIPYIAEVGDCDKFANRLYMRMCDFYGLNGVLEIWGMTTSGYHGFNLTLFKEGEGYLARLIEPQTDAIFIDQGPLGEYRPDKVIAKLAVLKMF